MAVNVLNIFLYKQRGSVRFEGVGYTVLSFISWSENLKCLRGKEWFWLVFSVEFSERGDFYVFFFKEICWGLIFPTFPYRRYSQSSILRDQQKRTCRAFKLNCCRPSSTAQCRILKRNQRVVKIGSLILNGFKTSYVTTINRTESF